ncbi:MAG: TAXI family TRAP transporter solute-binding subunit, partial [Pseudomonadota bacterium]
ACDTELVNISGSAIDGLIADNSFYRTATIPGGMYSGNADDVLTFGVGATFVTSAGVPDDVVYEVVSAVLTNFDDYKKLHPAFQVLTMEGLAAGGLTAPLHPGAARYYREAGIL